MNKNRNKKRRQNEELDTHCRQTTFENENIVKKKF